jgi:hypothetical protein
MRSSRVRRVKRTSRKSIGRALSRMPRSKRGKRSNKGGRTKKGSKRNILDELRETLSLPELESDLGILSVQKKKKSKKKKKKSKAWSAKLHGKGTKGKKGKKSHKKKHKKKMEGGSSTLKPHEKMMQRVVAKSGGYGGPPAMARQAACRAEMDKIKRLYDVEPNPDKETLEMYAATIPGCNYPEMEEIFRELRVS